MRASSRRQTRIELISVAVSPFDRPQLDDRARVDVLMARVAYTSSPPTTTAFGSLSKDVSELRVIFSFISVMDTYVSTASVNLAENQFF
jgi:hypothetical protein